MLDSFNTIEILYDYYKGHQKITTDTRNIQSGDIYFALKGDSFNGNHFAGQAIEKGAKFVIIDEGEIKSDSYLKVENVLKFLQYFASFHRSKLDIPVIGITGTNGKTTSKELLAEVLKSTFKISFTQGNFNNHIGVPLTLLSIPFDTEIAIIEMGANHIGEIQELSTIAKPTHGIITNIGKAHLEGFGSVEGIIKTKSELFDFLNTTKGTLFYNSQDPIINKITSKYSCSKVSFNSDSSHVQLASFSNSPMLNCEIKINKKKYQVSSNLFGEYNANNIVMAFSIGYYFHISPEKMISAIEDYEPTNNRSQIIQTYKNNTLILDAYNANPSSIDAAVNSFINIKADSKVYILGDMLELGSQSEEEHIKVLENLKTENNVNLVGDCFRKLKDRYSSFRFFENVEALKTHLIKYPIKDTTVLIKGSRGIKLEVLTDIL
jgi:UDP-N-acetylmuramoyl-tripeptide--D-alanyl-D-alanine ligase